MFKVQNSWGVNSGDNGFLWVAYSAIPNMVCEAYIVYPVKNSEYEFTIEGPDILCHNETYTIRNCPSTANVTWTIPRSNMCNSGIVPSYDINATAVGTGVQLVRKETYAAGTDGNLILIRYTGPLSISVNVVLNGMSYNLTKDIYVGTETKPVPTISGKPTSGTVLPYFRVGQSITMRCDNISANKLLWECLIPGVGNKTYTNTNAVTVKPTTPGYVTVKVINTEGCNDDNYQNVNIQFKEGFVINTNNPIGTGSDIQGKVYRIAMVDDESPISSTYSLEEQLHNNETEKIPYNDNFTVEVWSNSYGKMAAYKFNTSDIVIPTNGLSNGIYYLKLVINGEIKDVATITIR